MKTGRENPVPTSTVSRINPPYTILAGKNRNMKKTGKNSGNGNGNRIGFFRTVFTVPVFYTGAVFPF